MGMASAYSVNGNFYEFNNSKTETLADLYALFSDWGMTGNDIKHAIEVLASENNIPFTKELNKAQTPENCIMNG